MVYYDLCKKEQAKHVGYSVKSFHTMEVPEFDIKKENIEDRTIFSFFISNSGTSIV
jgi:hypothetical protein